MEWNLKTIARLLVIILLLGGVGFYIYRDVSRLPGEALPPPNGVLPPPPDEGGENPSLPPPAASTTLDRPLIIKNTRLSDAQKKAYTDKINEMLVLLRKDPGHYDAWIDLGLARKELGDSEGARDAWEQASAVDPNRSVGYGNLGVIYGFYLGDQAKAITNFEKAISIDPHYLYLYGQFSDFYKDVVGDKEKARAVLRRAQEASPKDREAIQKIIDSI